MFDAIIALSLILGTIVSLFLLWQALMYMIALFQRPAIERIVIGQIAAVLRQNLPLPTALALAGDSERGMARVYLKRISKLLAQGALLSEAIQLGFRDCSTLVVSLVAAGEKAGRLPAALEQAEEYLIRKARWRRLFDVPLGLYVMIVLTAACFIISGIMVAVIPKFKQIFADFGLALPPRTITLINISEWFVTGTPPGWTLIAMIPLVWIALRLLKVDGRPVTRRIGEFVRASLPGVRRAEFGRGMAEMLRLMRTAVAGGIDLSSAARISSDLDVNVHLRDRMRLFADLLERGAVPSDACKVADLGSVMATALAAGTRSGDMDAALRYAADYHEAIVARWWILAHSFVWPFCTVLLGTIVAFIVRALFEPLVHLIATSTGSGIN